ncbi:MAG: hypothetical protein ACLU37_06000 [Collinsella sp.]
MHRALSRSQRAATHHPIYIRRPRHFAAQPTVPQCMRRCTRRPVVGEHYLAPHQPGPLV